MAKTDPRWSRDLSRKRVGDHSMRSIEVRGLLLRQTITGFAANASTTSSAVGASWKWCPSAFYGRLRSKADSSKLSNDAFMSSRPDTSD
jgi:hypothetical protein